LAKVRRGVTISLDRFEPVQNRNAGRLCPDLVALRHTAYMQDAPTNSPLNGANNTRKIQCASRGGVAGSASRDCDLFISSVKATFYNRRRADRFI
jgi:hypothetical protein